MLRFYKQFMSSVLLALMYMREGYVEDISSTSIIENGKRYKRGRYNPAWSKQVHYTAIEKIMNKFGDDHKSIDEIIETIATQIANIGQHPEAEVDLIDTIVSMLQLPYGRNVIGGETLRKLRNAILNPEELQKFKTRVLSGELCCGDCGKTLTNYEMVTFVKDNNSVRFLCTNCVTPRVKACPSSNRDCEAVEIPAKILGQLNKVSSKCKVCSPKVEDIVRIAEGTPIPIEVPTITEALPAPRITTNRTLLRPGDPLDLDNDIAARIYTRDNERNEVREVDPLYRAYQGIQWGIRWDQDPNTNFAIPREVYEVPQPVRIRPQGVGAPDTPGEPLNEIEPNARLDVFQNEMDRFLIDVETGDLQR